MGEEPALPPLPSTLNPPRHLQIHPRAAVSSWQLVPTLAPLHSGAAATTEGLSAERSASSPSVLAGGHAFRGWSREGRAPSASRPPSRPSSPKRTCTDWAMIPSETRPSSEDFAHGGGAGRSAQVLSGDGGRKGTPGGGARTAAARRTTSPAAWVRGTSRK